MMGYRLILSVVMCSVFMLFSAVNSFSAEMKFGVMDGQKIIVQSNAGKDAKKRFEKRMKELKDSFKQEEDSLKSLQEEIKKKSSAWSEEKKTEKAREFQKMRRELQTKTEDARFEMKKMQDKELEPILKALEKVVAKFGKDNKYMVIMDARNGVLYFDNAVDISDTIVKKLNAEMAK